MKKFNSATRASIWTITSFTCEQLFRLLSNLILTRLLLPDAFGLMAVVTVVRMGVAMCTEMGIRLSVIRHSSPSEAYINTAWTMQVIRGALMFIAVMIVALVITLASHYGFVAANSVYAEPELPLLLVAMAITSIFLGFESPKVWFAERNMRIGGVVLIQLTTQISGIILMVALAWHYKSVWAIVYGSLFGAFARVVCGYLYLPGEMKIRFCWSKDAAFDLFHFGKWMFLSAVLAFFALNGDRVILAGYISAEQLGFYSISFFLASALKQMAEKLSGNVWFPLLSKINREREDELIDEYYRIRKKLDILVYSAVGGLYVLGPVLIHILYDERYAQAAWMLQILSISVISVSYSLANTLLLSQGNAKVGTITVALRSVALLALLPLSLEYFGMIGGLWCIALNPLIEIPVVLTAFYQKKMVNWSREFLFVPFIGVGYLGGQMLITLFSYF